MTPHSSPIFPIFVFEGHDLSVFLSEDNLSNYLEHYDVMDSLFVGYDFDGRQLELYFEEDKVVKCRLVNEVDQSVVLQGKLAEALEDTAYRSQPINELMTKVYAVALFSEKGFN
ncbi:hypothetical protein [Pseudodesulfovibrio sp. zrk46]|uniref:hypothetical protein n=1 Tax=Pseudodesulfovibrio sp. zrk46 TaxID=2725288 RepID=UPI00144965FC|nr:hypothetical protein [Pseudodesulfovibrio sp. zrk46]QJB55829.1 hypothetical protein HFN16_05150 [Pseudodesulfovibrio sp. zrk46]